MRLIFRAANSCQLFQRRSEGPQHIRGSANGRPAAFEAAHEGSTPSPRTWRNDRHPGSEADVTRSREGRNPGSSPGWGAGRYGRASRSGTATACYAVERQRLAGSTPVPSAGKQGRAPGRAAGLQNPCRGFDSFRPCFLVPVAERQRYRPATPDRRVQLPPGTLLSWGSGVPAALIRRRSRVQIPARVLWPCGPTATTPGSHPGNGGSIPSEATVFILVVQPESIGASEAPDPGSNPGRDTANRR